MLNKEGKTLITLQTANGLTINTEQMYKHWRKIRKEPYDD